MNKTVNQKAWFFVIPVFVLVAFNAIIPLMTVVNYAFQETFGNNVFKSFLFFLFFRQRNEYRNNLEILNQSI